jgi:DNA-binding transcriptional LysR family regulator
VDTDLLKTFLEVERTRHFGRAADNLYLTQAAVSSRIRQLESLIGTKLFGRQRNNITLTTAGERLKPHAESVLLALSRALQESALSDKQSLQLAIGGPPNLWDSWLHTYLSRIYQQLPTLALRADIQAREVLSKALLSRTLDLALLLDPPKIEELITCPLAELDLVLVSSYRDITFKEAVTRPYIQVDWGTSFNIQHAQILPAISAPVLHTSNGKIALEFIADNGGSAFLSEASCREQLAQGSLFRVSEAPVISRQVYAAYLEHNDKREMIEQVLQIMREQRR